MNLRSALISIRCFTGLSQTEFSKLLGVSDSWISNVERGKYNPEFATVQRYVDALGLKFSHVIAFAEVIDECKDWKEQMVKFVEITK